MKYADGIILDFLSKQEIIRSKKMNFTELCVIGFLVILGFIAYNNSRKVAREIRRLGADKS